ncbi:hypothetical protein DNTS_013673 [Danionella cerebrum]|uniref:PH domain-containing protein n=1 Tax=Danionella cerebrum TaxID=2873325 RepID=A0A553N4J7_9TELE|nr:hypothetical protein DNTS_013673 [Danionella translucida]
MEKESGSNASCGSDGDADKELCKGFLLKSPPSNQLKTKRSWKRRYFKLENNNTSHELKYYATLHCDKPKKTINTSTITSLCVAPETHPAFEWILKVFECQASSVLLMKTENQKQKREYFFIGDDRVMQSVNLNHFQGGRLLKTSSFCVTNLLRETGLQKSAPPNPSHAIKDKAANRAMALPRRSTLGSITIQHDQSPESNSSDTEEYERDDTVESIYEEMQSRDSVIVSDSLLDCVTKVIDLKMQESDEATTQSQSCQQTEVSSLVHKGDHILAINDFQTDTVKWTIRRQRDSTCLNAETS